MLGKLKTLVLSVILLFVISFVAPAQKRIEIKPPGDAATLAEVQEWLVGALGKYAAYKTRVEAVGLSNVRFDRCVLNFVETRKLGSVSTATMGTTRTTNVVKNDIAIDLGKVRDNGISSEDHIYPELQSVKLWYDGFDLSPASTNGRVYSIVVKREAGDAVKTALVKVRRLCKAPN